MSQPEVYPLSIGPISAYSFNADRSKLAVSLNSNEVQVQTRVGHGWQVEETLPDHDKLVTSIDWAPHSNRIVTCSQDRNAYVWNLTHDPATGKQTWAPTLVLLRLNRSATYVRWSPNEQKFAVASGARTIAVCQYDDENNWWVAKHIKKPIRSTVLSLDWHPNSVLIAAGSADSKARVFSAYLKGADQRPSPSVWGEKLPFNTLCGEFASPSGGWVHGVAFSPSGDSMAFASHDSTITIVYPSGEGSPPHAVHVINLTSLPAVTLLFTNEYTMLVAGHDCQPYVLQGDLHGGWKLIKTLDDARGAAPTSRFGAATAGRLNNEAFNRFRAADSRGVGPTYGAPEGSASSPVLAPGTRLTPTGTELTTVHQNTITSLRLYDGVPGAISRVSSGGVDGKLVIWDVDSVGAVTSGVGRMGM